MNPIQTPTHHFHISTGFAFVIALFVIAFAALMVWFVLQLRKPKAASKVDVARPRPLMSARAPYSPSTYSTSRATDYRSAPYRPAAPVSPAAPYAPSTPVAPASSGFTAGEGFMGGLAAGALLDSALHSRRDDPPVVYEAPSYDPGPNYDSGSSSSSSSDSGFSYDSGASTSDSGSSDSGSSGGFDVSW